jgi:hypothetical protein
MLPLFFERIPGPVYRTLQQLMLAIFFVTGDEIERTELDVIEQLLKLLTD